MLELMIELSLVIKGYSLVYKESYTTGCGRDKFDAQFQEEICGFEMLYIGTMDMRAVPLLATLVKSLCSVNSLTLKINKKTKTKTKKGLG